MEESNSNLCTIYIVRHGETDWNVKKIIQGHKDTDLNSTGKQQAHLLQGEFRNIKFDAIFSSDLQRARKTAEIIALEHKLAVQTTKLLRERSFGHLEGQSTKILDEIFTGVKDQTKNLENSFPDVEDDEKLISRVITFLREIAVGYPGKVVLVASHGGVLRLLLIHLGFVDLDNSRGVAINNGAYIKLQSDGIDFFIQETKGITKK